MAVTQFKGHEILDIDFSADGAHVSVFVFVFVKIMRGSEIIELSNIKGNDYQRDNSPKLFLCIHNNRLLQYRP